MEIGGYTMASPWFLLLFLLLPLMWWWRNKSGKYTSPELSFPHTGSMDFGTSIKATLLYYLPLFRYISMGLLILAMARPQKILKEEEVKTEGIDIVLALDLSSSMKAADFQPNRLEASKEMAARFVDRRPDDRIGLVIFAGESFTYSPLTTDHKTVKQYISTLAFGMIDDKTAIGMGLASAVNCLKNSESKSKIIVFLTDGENTVNSYIKPLTAADIAKELDIKVYTIGVGSKQTFGGLFSMNSSVDEKLLTQIADVTGGQYFRATNEVVLDKIYEQIDLLEKTEFEVSTFTRYSEEFRKFLFLALFLIIAEFILRNTLLRTLP